MHKKANLGMILVIVVLGLVILSLVLIDFSKRECNKNSECSQTAYCGADYKCHEFPKEIVVKENSYVTAAIILGIALIVAAYIFRGGRIIRVKKS
ncbi:MAG: hypothetical protein WCV90_01685 [Candidatus Woesearchaeota archaeon]|jgi:ABC-type Fe3+-citrate transport system substrate-binding protein